MFLMLARHSKNSILEVLYNGQYVLLLIFFLYEANKDHDVTSTINIFHDQVLSEKPFAFKWNGHIYKKNTRWRNLTINSLACFVMKSNFCFISNADN